MTSQFLLFQLYGPMASWGEIAVGEERDTASHPTRTAILGLCAAARGIPRTEEEQLLEFNNSLGVAVCVHAPGDIMRDFHTVQVPSGKRARDLPTRRDEIDYGKLNATLTKRHYRTDAYYVACLWRRDPEGPVTLPGLAEALETPEFSLFLGRKCCVPALPLSPDIVEVSTLKEAIRSYPVDPIVAQLIGDDHDRAVYWDAEATGIDPGFDAMHENERWDRLLSRRRWQFARRQEAYGRIQGTITAREP